jgi:hypothetical protein
MEGVRSGLDVLARSGVKDLLAGYTWPGVFDRIDGVYRKLV